MPDTLHQPSFCSNDLVALDALLDLGADIESPGSVMGGGTPLSDAVAFRQWEAARRLVARGAHSTIWQSAALGMMDRLQEYFTGDSKPSADEVTNAFWNACHGGQLAWLRGIWLAVAPRSIGSVMVG